MAERTRTGFPKRFVLVWAGQALSTIGTATSSFAVALWVFQETGSYGWLALLSALIASSTFFAAPILPLLDRVPKRTAMLIGDTLAAAFTGVAVLAWTFSTVQPWQLIALTFFGGVAQVVQTPAYEALIPTLVEDEQLDRANGLVQTGGALATIASPAVAALLLSQSGIGAAFAFDLVTFVFAAATLRLLTSADEPQVDHVAADVAPDATKGSLREAVHYLFTRNRRFLWLIGLIAAINLVLGIFNVVLIGLATELGGIARAGWPPAIGGLAMLTSGLMIARYGLPDNKVLSLVAANVAFGLALVLSVARPSFWLLCFGLMLAFANVPAAQASVSSLFQRGVPADMHGRVMGLRTVLGRGTGPVGSLLAAPLATWSAPGTVVVVGSSIALLGVLTIFLPANAPDPQFG